MKKISVYGSAVSESENLVKLAQIIGELIAKDNNAIITGACAGLPFEAVKGAKSFNGYSIGYSAVANQLDHEKLMGTNLNYYNYLELIPKNYKHINNIEACRKYRNVASVVDCDAAIFIGGRWGTLNEFAIAYDTNKIIGVLTSSGKFSSQAQFLIDFFEKPTNGKVIFDDDPIRLYQSVIDNLR